jgi:hypothetical protein
MSHFSGVYAALLSPRHADGAVDMDALRHQMNLPARESLPTPWGLKVPSETRGFTKASYPFPLSPARVPEAAELKVWFAGWMDQAIKTKAGVA